MIIILTIAVLFGFGKDIVPAKAERHIIMTTAETSSLPQYNKAVRVVPYTLPANTRPTRITCQFNTKQAAPNTSDHTWSHQIQLSLHPI